MIITSLCKIFDILIVFWKLKAKVHNVLLVSSMWMELLHVFGTDCCTLNSIELRLKLRDE